MFADEDCATRVAGLAKIDGTFAQSAVHTAIAGTSLLNYPIATGLLLRTTEEKLGIEASALG